MAITRIKNNQITDSSIVASSKVQNLSITSGLLENDLTYGSNLTVTGNLTVNGTTTTINTTNTSVEDPIMVLASQQAGAGAVDIGFIGERGTDTNIAFVWDESANEFACGFTAAADSNSTIVVSAYADLHVNALTTAAVSTFTDLNLTGALDVNGESTLASAVIEDLTDNRIVIVGTGGIIEDDANFTFDATTLTVGALTVTQASGNLLTTGTIDTGAATLDTATVSNLTDNRIPIAGTAGLLGDDANLTMDGTTFEVGTAFDLVVASGNLTTTGTIDTGAATLDSATVSNLTDNRIPVTGVSGLLGDDANLTFDGTTFEVGTLFDVTVASGNTAVGGTLTVTGVSDLNEALTTKDISVEAVASVTSGSFVVGETYIITATGTTNFVTEQSAADSNPGTQFTAIAVGTGTGTADLIQILDAGANRWTNLADPVNAQDAATQAYVDSVSNTGFTFNGDTGTTAISGGDTMLIQGTTLEIETAVSGDTMTIGLPASVTITTALTSSGTLNVTGVSTLGVINASGLASLDAGIDVDGLFTVADGTGNTVVGGTLGVTGISTLTGDLIVNGDTDLNGYNTLTGMRADASTSTATLVVGNVYRIDAITLVDWSGVGGSATAVVGDVFTATATDASLLGTAELAFISMSGNVVHDIGDPVELQDAATKNYVDTISTTGFTIDGDLGTGTSAISGGNTLLVAGTASQIETTVNTGVDTIIVGLTDNVSVVGTLGTGGLATLASASITGALDINGATTLTTTTWDGASTIDAGANKIINMADPTLAQDAATKIYVDSLVSSSTIWKDPVVDSDLVELAGANPGTMAALITAYSLTTGDNVSFISTAAFTFDAGGTTVISAAAGDIVNLTVVSGTVGDYSVVETPLAIGDRFIIAAEHGTIGAVLTLLAMADTFTLADGDLIEYVGGTITAEASWTTPDGRSGNAGGGTEMVQGLTVLNSDPDSVHYGHTFFYDAVGNSWIEISGPGSLGAGTNLEYTGNVLNVSPQGPASGLDADLLDSQQGTYYLDATNFTNQPSPVITLGGDLTGSVTLTALASGTLTATIVDDSHNHIISNVDGLQTALDGKLDDNGDVMNGNYSIPTTFAITMADAPTAGTELTNKDYVDGLTTTGWTVTGDTGTPDVIPLATTLSILGTANEIETAVTAQTITVGLPDNVTITGLLTANGGITADAGAFIVADGTGNVTTTGTLTVTGLATLNGGINADAGAFIVADGTGNVTTTGTLTVSGLATLDGGITVDGTNFTVNGTSGAISTTSTLGVTGISTLGIINASGLASLDAGIDVDGVFTVADATGDVVTAGDLTVAGATDLNGYNTFTGFDADASTTTATLVVGNTYRIATILLVDWSGAGGSATAVVGDVFTATATDASLLGTAELAFVSMSGNLVHDVAEPVELSDAATKNYVDGVAGSGFTLTGDSGSTTISGGNTLAVTGTAGETTVVAGTGVDTLVIGLATNVTVAGTLNVTGTAEIDDLTIIGTAIDAVAGTEIVINEAGADINFRVEGDTDINAIFVDAGTDSINIGTATAVVDAKLQVAGTDSVVFSIGTTAQRPAIGVEGMMRYNSTTSEYEFYDGVEWAGFGAAFTVIASEVFAGTGSQSIFTLASSQTTASCIVSLNGVLQEPTTVYGVVGTALTFTTAPAVDDVIEVRELTTTSTITALNDGTGASVLAATATEFELTGDIIPTVDATYNLGSATFGFDTIYGQATSAVYADLAEIYSADADIAPGTVVTFGGSAEVTTSAVDGDRKVAGIVSTNPAYLMNSEADGVAVALRGRVPCKVSGIVSKGDMMVSDGNGGARAEENPAYGSVIGKALADSEGDNVIEIVVG